MNASNNQFLQSMANWDDTIDVTVGESDVDLSSGVYAAYRVFQLGNEDDSDGVVFYRTWSDGAGADQEKNIAAGQQSGKLPRLKTIKGSLGSTTITKLKLYCQSIPSL